MVREGRVCFLRGFRGGAITGKFEMRSIRRDGDIDGALGTQSVQSTHIQCSRFFNPASTTPFVGSAIEIVGVEEELESPGPEPEPRPSGFMRTEACRSAAPQFGSGVGSGGSRVRSGRCRCVGSRETFGGCDDASSEREIPNGADLLRQILQPMPFAQHRGGNAGWPALTRRPWLGPWQNPMHQLGLWKPVNASRAFTAQRACF